jgi:hypothetical protein
LPDESVSWIQRHRLTALIGQQVHLAPANLAPAIQRNTLHALTLTRELLQLGKNLDERGIAWLTVKGPLLAHALWGNVAHRHAGDLDIVVGQADIPRLDRWLQAHGYRRDMPDFDLTPRQFQAWLTSKYEFGYRSVSNRRIRLELKWRLDGVPELPDLLHHPHREDFPQRTLPTLPPDINLRYLCEHGARHGWFRLFWLLDVARLLKTQRFDWNRVLPGGTANTSCRCVQQAMILCRELLETKVPTDFPAFLREGNANIRPLVEEAKRLMAVETPTDQNTGEWLRQLRYRTRLHPGWQGTRDALRPHLHSPLNWQTIRLPDSLFWLYAPLGPLLWLIRIFQRDRTA